MDRSKQSMKKSGRRGLPEMVPLGPKGRSQDSSETRSATPPISSDRKREGSSSVGVVGKSGTSAGPVPTKKPKLTSPTPLGKPSMDFPKAPQLQGASTSGKYSKPSVRILDVPSSELVDRVLEADINEDDKKIAGLLCGALYSLKNSRAKPDSALFLGLMYLAKTKPMLFENETVVEGICSLLKRDMSVSFKSKGNPLVPVLACNLLMHAFLYEDNWPEIFVKPCEQGVCSLLSNEKVDMKSQRDWKAQGVSRGPPFFCGHHTRGGFHQSFKTHRRHIVYMEDALGERVWVDQPRNVEFVNNILTAFGTRLPPKHLSVIVDANRATGPHPEGSSSGGSSPLREESDSSSSEFFRPSEEGGSRSESPSENVSKRFTLIKDNIDKYAVNLLKEQLTRRQGLDIPRNLLRLLTRTCGLADVRLMVAPKLELWLQNPKLTRPAQELLLSLCVNCCTHSPQDVEVIGHLIRLRLKTKPLINHYILSMKELLGQHPENLSTVLKHTIYNELSTTRNPNNMALIAAIFQHSPEKSAQVLASVFQTLLINKDDYIRAVRALFREIFKTLRYDLDFTTFCRSIMSDRLDKQFNELDTNTKERFVKSIADVICLTSLLSATPQVREAVSAYARREQKDLEVIRKFQWQLAEIQRDAIHWMHTVVPKMLSLPQKDFCECVQKLLFMLPPEAYCNKDNWPPESDRSFLVSLLSEVPVEEDCLLRLLVMGLTREITLAPGDAVDLVDKVVKRAAMLHSEDFSVLQVERFEIVDALLRCCTYHHPDNITLPAEYKPPSLAIINLYWKTWVILLILAAFNPQTIGKLGWDQYPILRCLMEMVMTNNFKFPLPTFASTQNEIEEFLTSERQMSELEKEEILEFENHLASVTINESNSLLITQLVRMEPSGHARRPPNQVTDQLQQLNKVLHLGHMLCRSREPDFLLDIIHRQGTSQSMAWLSELVNSSDDSLDMLPIQCLCEFLMNAEIKDGEEDSEQKQHAKQTQLCARLQSVLYDKKSKPERTYEVMSYFVNKLAVPQATQRERSLQVLKMLLSIDTSEQNESMEVDDVCPELMDSHSWLLYNFPMLPHFDGAKNSMASALRKAIQIETDPTAVSAYIAFLAKYTPDSELGEVTQDLSQLIVERLTMVTFLLPKPGQATELTNCTLCNMLRVFSRYIQKATSTQNEGYSWSDTQDQVFLHWSSGKSATMHILVVHAMVILLTYGPPTDDTDFVVLLNAWFPDQEGAPSAYLVDTSEEALLLPDWLKLRMIRSSVPQLVDAALQELDPSQLVLFVQSFGIPVASVSKLLAHLDAAVEQVPEALSQAVAAKAYMARLVEVQQMRGASGGNKFKMLLQDGEVKETKTEENDPQDKADSAEIMDVDTQKKPVTVWDSQTCLVQLKKIFLSSDGNKQEATELSRSLLVTLMQEATGKARYQPGRSLYSSLVHGLYTMLSLEEKDKLVLGINLNPNFAISLFRLIIHEEIKRVSENFERLYRVISFLLKSTVTNNKGLRRFLQHYKEKMKDKRTVLSEPMDTSTESESKTKDSNICKVLQNNPEELFKTSPSLDPKAQDGGSTYSLALLTHQSDWKVIHVCIDRLLEPKDQRYDAGRVLDFLSASVHIPKVWQGRDPRASQRHGRENMLHLHASQVCQISAYIAKEAKEIADKEDETTAITKMQTRLSLLTRCCSHDSHCLGEVIKYLSSWTVGENSKWFEALLTELYLCIPNIIHALTDSAKSNLSLDYSNLPSGVDNLTHRLLTLLSTHTTSDAGKQRKDDADAALRSLASTHPSLVLRQLPMMAVLLRGRTYHTLKEFRTKGHLSFFTSIVSVLLLLQPRLFQSKPEDLEDVFQPFFECFGHYGPGSIKKWMFHVFTKFINLLSGYYVQDAAAAKPMLQKHVALLTTISKSFPNLHPLKSLLASLSLPDDTKTSQDGRQTSQLGSFLLAEDIPGVSGREDTSSPVPNVMKNTQPMGAEEIQLFQTRLRKNLDPEEILDALGDLDNRCADKTEFLGHFADELSALLSSTDRGCRQMAFALTIRYCKLQPSASRQFLPAFLEVLQHGDGEVIKTALNHLPDFSLLSQENAPLLLQHVFQRAVKSSMETTSAISDTLQILNMEAAAVSAV